jgi:hypothetical protein
MYFKKIRFNWAGHVIRMDNNRKVKKVFNTKPTEIRKIERPKLRWEDDVIQEEFEKLSAEKGKLAEAPEEGQGPLGAVESMMVMMMIGGNDSLRINKYFDRRGHC